MEETKGKKPAKVTKLRTAANRHDLVFPDETYYFHASVCGETVSLTYTRRTPKEKFEGTGPAWVTEKGEIETALLAIHVRLNWFERLLKRDLLGKVECHIEQMKYILTKRYEARQRCKEVIEAVCKV